MNTFVLLLLHWFSFSGFFLEVATRCVHQAQCRRRGFAFWFIFYRTFYLRHFLLISITCLSWYILIVNYRSALIGREEHFSNEAQVYCRYLGISIKILIFVRKFVGGKKSFSLIRVDRWIDPRIIEQTPQNNWFQSVCWPSSHKFVHTADIVASKYLLFNCFKTYSRPTTHTHTHRHRAARRTLPHNGQGCANTLITPFSMWDLKMLFPEYNNRGRGFSIAAHHYVCEGETFRCRVWPRHLVWVANVSFTLNKSLF